MRFGESVSKYKGGKMKQKIEEKTKKLEQIIEAINEYRSQIIKLEKEGLMLQGELRILNELEIEKTQAEKPKEVEKKK